MRTMIYQLTMFLICADFTAAQNPNSPPTQNPGQAPTKRNIDQRSNDHVLVPLDGQRQPVVARVLVRSRKRMLLKLPNGELRQVQASATLPTQRPFTPFTVEAMRQRLRTEYVGFKIREAGPFILVYNTDNAFFEFANVTLRSTYDSVMQFARRNRFATTPPETPLIVVLFRTKARFQQQSPPAARELDGYYLTANNRMYGYQFQTESEPWESAQIRCERTLAHEGVHQLLHNIGLQKRLSVWPLWFNEGFAEHLVPESFGNRIPTPNPNVGRLTKLLNARSTASNSWPLNDLGSGQLAQRIVTIRDLDTAGYSFSWALTRYLAGENRTKFVAYVREMTAAKSLVPLDARKEQARFTRHFGDDWATIEKGMLLLLQQKPHNAPKSVYLVIGNSEKGTTGVITPRTDLDGIKRAVAKRLDIENLADVQFTVKKFDSLNEAKQALRKMRSRVAK